MNREERKRIRRELENRQERLRVQETPRPILASVHYPGAGPLVLRFIRQRSFRPADCWEVTHTPPDDSYRVFYSRGTEPESDQLIGYEEQNVSAELVADLVDQARAISVPIYPGEQEFAMADGNNLRLECHSGTCVSAYEWEEGHALEAWRDLDAFAFDFLESLGVR